jgi:CHRD domain
MRSRLLIPALAIGFTGAIASCDNKITNITEGLNDTATWTATLNAANERQANPINSPATGRAWFTDNGNTITYFVQYNGLVAPLTLSHIHRGTADVSGAVMVDLRPATGQQSGVWAGTIDMTAADVSAEAGTQSPADLRALLNSGGAYVNIHSSTYPAGEIRGQVARR